MEIIDIDNLMLKLNESYLSLIKNTIIETHKFKKKYSKISTNVADIYVGFFLSKNWSRYHTMKIHVFT